MAEPSIDTVTRMKLNSLLPCVYCADDRDFNDRTKWRRAILRRVRKEMWEVFDEYQQDVIEEITMSGDNGLLEGWGLYYKFPNNQDLIAAAEAAELEAAIEAEDESSNMFSPRRKEIRDLAFHHLKKQATRMQSSAEKKDKNTTPVVIGDVVHVALHKVDTTKVDPKQITGVVVDTTATGQFRIACENGVLKRTYPRHNIFPVAQMSNNRELVNLEQTFLDWRGLPKIDERAAARHTSAVGGQGHVHCNCQGKCVTARCKCRKAGRVCNSRCHRTSKCCENYDH
jgi:translation initiation factor IF-1